MIAVNSLPEIEKIQSSFEEHRALLTEIKSIVADPKLADEKLPSILELIDSAYQTKKISSEPSEPVSTFGELMLHSNSLANQQMFAAMKDETLVKIIDSFGHFLQRRGLESAADAVFNRSEDHILSLSSYSCNMDRSGGIRLGDTLFYGFGFEALEELKTTDETKQNLREKYPDGNFGVTISWVGGNTQYEAIRSVADFFESNNTVLLLGFNREVFELTADNFLEIASKLEAEEKEMMEQWKVEHRAERESELSEAMELRSLLPTFLRNAFDKINKEMYGELGIATLLKEALYLVVQLGDPQAIRNWLDLDIGEQRLIASGITADSGYSNSFVGRAALAYRRFLDEHPLPSSEEFEATLLKQLKDNQGQRGVRGYLDSMYSKIKNEPLLLNNENREDYAKLYAQWGMGSHAERIREMSTPSKLLSDMYNGVKTPNEVAYLIKDLNIPTNEEKSFLEGVVLSIKGAGLTTNLLNEYAAVFNRKGLVDLADKVTSKG